MRESRKGDLLLLFEEHSVSRVPSLKVASAFDALHVELASAKFEADLTDICTEIQASLDICTSVFK